MPSSCEGCLLSSSLPQSSLAYTLLGCMKTEAGTLMQKRGQGHTVTEQSGPAPQPVFITMPSSFWAASHHGECWHTPRGSHTCTRAHTCEHTHRHVPVYIHMLACSGICGLDPTASLHGEFSPSPDVQSSEPSHNAQITETYVGAEGALQFVYLFTANLSSQPHNPPSELTKIHDDCPAPRSTGGSKDLPSADTNPNYP